MELKVVGKGMVLVRASHHRILFIAPIGGEIVKNPDWSCPDWSWIANAHRLFEIHEAWKAYQNDPCYPKLIAYQRLIDQELAEHYPHFLSARHDNVPSSQGPIDF